MPVSRRWVVPGRVLAIEVIDAEDGWSGETLRLTGDLSDPAALEELVARMVAESCARTGAKP